MKAVLLREPKSFEIIELPPSSPPGIGEVLVRVHNVGICGTDIHGYLGSFPFYSYPRIPGHELGVEVVAIGEGVDNVQIGDRCSVEPYINCQSCFACQRGHTNCCESLQVLGVHVDGGMRPEFVVPARKLHVSRHLSFEKLALVETLAIGCHAVARGAARAGEDVLIIGAGPIGLSVLEFVKLADARPIVMDAARQRLDFCQQQMDVSDTVLFEGDGSEENVIEDLTDGKMPTLVIDATGNNHSMSNALNYVSFAGRLVYVGITTKEIQFVHPLMHRREMTLLASRNALPEDFRSIISRLEKGDIDTKPWMTHHSTMQSLARDFPTYVSPASGVVKAMVTIDSP